LRRLVIAMLSGWLVSWLGVAALITLAVAWPRNPVPRVLLVAWAVLAAVSLVVPGTSRRAIRGSGPVVALAIPFLPLARAALAVWPHLPMAVRDFLEGRARRDNGRSGHVAGDQLAGAGPPSHDGSSGESGEL
jgi:hypothetical protein